MKKIFGILLIIVGILGGITLGIVMLAYGLYDIFTNFETLTFGQFLGDVFLIIGREILAAIVVYTGVIVGFSMLTGGRRKVLNRFKRF
jgi:hypothetical protein